MKKRWKWFGILGLMSIMVTIGLAEHANAKSGTPTQKDRVYIDFFSSTFGSGSYVLGTALEAISAKHHPYLRINNLETPGWVWHMRTIFANPERHKTTILGGDPPTLSMAYAGKKPHYDKPLPVQQLKFLTTQFISNAFLVTLDTPKTIRELDGKSIGFGRATQMSWTIEPETVLRKGWGIDFKSVYLGPNESMQALLDGRVVACPAKFYSTGDLSGISPAGSLTTLQASGRPYYFISMGKPSTIAKASESSKIAMGADIIPAGTLKNQPEPICVIQDVIGIMAHETFPEDLAYEFTKLCLDYHKDFSKYHSRLGKLCIPSTIAYGWFEDERHPGAIRAFEEAGIPMGHPEERWAPWRK